jgi:hypothetical protein
VLIDGKEKHGIEPSYSDFRFVFRILEQLVWICNYPVDILSSYAPRGKFLFSVSRVDDNQSDRSGINHSWPYLNWLDILKESDFLQRLFLVVDTQRDATLGWCGGYSLNFTLNPVHIFVAWADATNEWVENCGLKGRRP